MATSPWPTVHAERAALADDLTNVDLAAWDTPSLCKDWTVRQVLAHLTSTATMTPPKFLGSLASAGFRFNAMTAKNIAKGTAGRPADGLAAFQAAVNRSSGPPGPVDSWLGEIILHGEDIRRPLGIKHDYPVEALVRLADFYKGSNMVIGAKNRIEGLTLTATDTEWSTGSGPEVSGPLLSLLMAMTGRKAALGDLTGDGVATLAERD
jgi:uncharacterized protein (TIGR03083 family)